MKTATLLLAGATGALTPVAATAAPEPEGVPADLPGVLVTARLDSVPAFELPASLDVVDLQAGSARPRSDVSEVLSGIPGLLARDRGNRAQDTQLSIRGFGARSTFGVRGVRLYADGIPATMPDGQGQVSHFALAAGDRIEVMRGPFSALYGNSSGGVVQLWSADGTPEPSLDLRATAGRYGHLAGSARLRGTAGGTGYNVSAAVLDSDGYRDHGQARRSSLNARLHRDLESGGRIELVGNHFHAPDAQDPLGLTRAQMQADPRQATAVAHDYDTRKSVRQDQLGLHWRQPLGGGWNLRASSWAGQRDVVQYLAVPPAAQANPLHSGGVIDLDGAYGGADARVAWRDAGGRFELTAGASFERQRQDRHGYENFLPGDGGPRLGVRGALRRDEVNTVRSFDQYLQAWWKLAPRWALQAGARHSQVRFEANDRYVTAGNPDDSGSVRYSAFTPVAGLVFSASDDLRLYLSAGRGFETPTFNELSYRADGGAGLAFDLRPARSDNLELGLKWRSDAGTAVEAALFRVDTEHELAVASNSGGRSSFRNVGGARREGAELSAHLPLTAAWSLQVAATWLDARFSDGFGQVAAGAAIPGVARRQGWARLQWRGQAWEAALEGLALDAVPVNDAGSESAAGHGLLHLEAARSWDAGGSRLRAFARVDNVLDRQYAGSVIVNESNGRYYEPGPGRALLLGMELRR
ncbi:TonB-dependent receptor [Pseudoxanthomonas sp. SGNA-20]|uniref:TonB-dependent receptor family protein n=1 Tax=Pseudoxanthomonas sp. SGNA-20 TaxID=2493088 RepID=UPI000F644C21|nr:TonB-dependent receptor [Pseudoxanthomonas sp. SGNA-20]RRN59348.1 TonB-dependent receptor [Pseudoxanthomonas sp. SGNA-20]